MSPDFKTLVGGALEKPGLDCNVNLLKDNVEAIWLDHCYLLYLLLCNHGNRCMCLSCIYYYVTMETAVCVLYLAAVVVYRYLYLFMLLLLY